MNHKFIESLVEVYKAQPDENTEMAVRNMAVFLEGEIEMMEISGETVTREALIERIYCALKEYKRAA